MSSRSGSSMRRSILPPECLAGDTERPAIQRHRLDENAIRHLGIVSRTFVPHEGMFAGKLEDRVAHAGSLQGRADRLACRRRDVGVDIAEHQQQLRLDLGEPGRACRRRDPRPGPRCANRWDRRTRQLCIGDPGPPAAPDVRRCKSRWPRTRGPSHLVSHRSVSESDRTPPWPWHRSAPPAWCGQESCRACDPDRRRRSPGRAGRCDDKSPVPPRRTRARPGGWPYGRSGP